MKAAGGEARENPEGPLEKGIENIEGRLDAGKESVSERLDSAASMIDRTGMNVADRTGRWEENVFHIFSDSLRSASDYIEGVDVKSQIDRLVINIRKNPSQALAIALGAGLIIGLIIRRR